MMNFQKSDKFPRILGIKNSGSPWIEFLIVIYGTRPRRKWERVSYSQAQATASTKNKHHSVDENTVL